ncbi:MAG TPA: MBL fold metallo-hydrolase [Opitutaceae bacterium]|jgi:phosphoribosyl 1,2-cyclic phosphate phosphodiesterase|nr:MBL fold metallo-hydrolase [Opitutaceae bacterium]
MIPCGGIIAEYAQAMEIVFMGTGTSQGVPMIACDCAVCRSADPRNRRSRTSVHVVMDGVHFQVDAAPEFRLQCLANDIRTVDYFILTHGHADHIAGMDDLRRYCDLRGGTKLPVYATSDGLARVLAMFPYAITERPLAKGYPAFALEEMPPALELPCGVIRSTPLPHGGVNTLGLVFEERSTGKRFAYYTDCKRLPREAVSLAQGADVLVIDGLRPEPHPTHLSIPEALEAAKEVRAAKTYLIHLTHLSEHVATADSVSPGADVAYDGLRVILN